MLGVFVNTGSIVLGSLLGLVLKKGIRPRVRQAITNVTALCVLVIGIIGAIKTEEILLLLISLVLGSYLGEMLRLEQRLNIGARRLERRLVGSESNLAQGFVTASLIFCVGSMAIVGSIESGLAGNHTTLFAKSVLDGVFSIFFTSTMGIGVAFSALAVLIYEGLLTLLAGQLRPLFDSQVLLELSAVGGVIIMAIGINQLQLKKMRIGNMLPAIFIPLVYYLLLRLF